MLSPNKVHGEGVPNLSDLNIPLRNIDAANLNLKFFGYDLARALRSASPDRPRVMVAVTGWGQPEDLRRTTEAGFDHHLVKPPDFEVLREICALGAPSRSAGR